MNWAVIKNNTRVGLEATGRAHSAHTLRPGSAHSLCGVSGAKEMLPRASAKAPFQNGSWTNQYFNNNREPPKL